MRRRRWAICVQHSLDDGLRLVALQGDQADARHRCCRFRCDRHHFGGGHRAICAASRGGWRPCPAQVSTVQPDGRRRRWARRQSSLAWQLDDRAAPDTVPMKVVPHQCGALGRSRPALPAQSGGVVGSSSPSVPVRRVPHAGHLVQSLRSRQPVLQPHLLAPEARPRPTRGRQSLPTLACRTLPARRTIAALARAHRAASCPGRHRRCRGHR
jgi:hypothetical protein